MRPASAFLVLLSVALWLPSTLGWGSNQDKVLLEKVTAITLEEGKMTNSRRVSPVQQLECAGGSAGCYGYRPKVVQCVNSGFDGYNVQWECKADMDSKYRFGHLDVSCEGYDYPDDPYVLRGSCGLRYELDFTEEGHRARDYGHGSPGYDTPRHHASYSKSSGFGIGTLIQLAIIGVIVYCVLGSCFGSQQRAASGYSSSSGGYGSSGYQPTAGGSGGPGFWTGAATGGALGYLLGGNRRGYGGGGYGRSGWYGGGYGGGGGGYSSHHSSGGGSRTSSSRTTSGFGSTSRR